ncbi:MAG: lysoplasmalogenase, partial [Bacteroidota bacterium]
KFLVNPWSLVIALVFSLGGDTLLVWKYDLFVFGLGSFLVAHVFYAITFVRFSHKINQVPIIKRLPLLPALVVAPAILVFILIAGGLKDLAVPVILYMVVILIMAVMALNRYERTTPKSFRWVFFGALMFMLSDSLIAINKFQGDLFHASFFIILTYGIAQGCIVFGLSKHG